MNIFNKKIIQLNYKGFSTSVYYDNKDKLYYGKINDIDDLVNYQLSSFFDIRKEFCLAVDNYLKTNKLLSANNLKETLLNSIKITLSFIDTAEVTGDYLKRFREKFNLSITALANILLVKKKTIKKWESNKRKIDRATAILLKLIYENPDLIEQVYKVNNNTYIPAEILK